MPNLRDHLKLSKNLLGYSNPLVHRLLDYQGVNLEHRYRHNPHTVRAIKELLGVDAEREAWLHILTDWGIIRFMNYSNRKNSFDNVCTKKIR